eukprot:TRINITY_DN190907_c0_g1_i1.p1 TRINITY_DN190907_c0_g1~~TRINITY_DN190907_c0_g1_i1.p1  ORF type:complete len:178 (-),score=23.43 TRINITY_DN190907_c0_g1_i1:26-559(-)
MPEDSWAKGQASDRRYLQWGEGDNYNYMVLFKRKRQCRELADGAPTGSLVTNNESGWMDKDMFMTWIRHFTTHVKPSPDRPVLLIMDGHSSHTRSLAAIDYARENGIVMLSLPPHSTHRLQPLDVSFFKPLQSFYIQEQETWLRTNPGRKNNCFPDCWSLQQSLRSRSLDSNSRQGL